MWKSSSHWPVLRRKPHSKKLLPDLLSLPFTTDWKNGLKRLLSEIHFTYQILNFCTLCWHWYSMPACVKWKYKFAMRWRDVYSLTNTSNKMNGCQFLRKSKRWGSNSRNTKLQFQKKEVFIKTRLTEYVQCIAIINEKMREKVFLRLSDSFVGKFDDLNLILQHLES